MTPDAVVDEPAMVHDADSGGNPGDLGQPVTGQEYRHALVAGPELHKQRADLHDADRVQTVHRLVEFEKSRPVQECLGEPEPLPIA